MIRIHSLIVVLLVLSTAVVAQTNKDKDAFKDQLKAREQQRKDDIKEYAQQNKIPVTGTGTDGEYMYLHHISNGKPVYYTTRGGSSTSANMPSSYIRMDNNEWKPLENNTKLEIVNSSYLSIKSTQEMIGVYVLNSDGRYFYKSKNLGTKELMITTRKMRPDEYIICVRTPEGINTYKVYIN